MSLDLSIIEQWLQREDDELLYGAKNVLGGHEGTELVDYEAMRPCFRWIETGSGGNGETAAPPDDETEMPPSLSGPHEQFPSGEESSLSEIMDAPLMAGSIAPSEGFNPLLCYGQTIECFTSDQFVELLGVLKNVALRVLPPGIRFEIRMTPAMLGASDEGIIVTHDMGWVSYPSFFADLSDWQEFEAVCIEDRNIFWDVTSGFYICARMTTPGPDVPPWDNRLEEYDG